MFDVGSTVIVLLPPAAARWDAALQPGARLQVGQGLGTLVDRMSERVPWHPTAPLPTLRLRAELLGAARAFFAARGVLEVDTPALVRHAVTDRHIHCARVELPGHTGALFLHSSPEYAMKRLRGRRQRRYLSIAHVFRGNESGSWHNAEFTLIESYRGAFSMRALMAEVAELAGRATRCRVRRRSNTCVTSMRSSASWVSTRCAPRRPPCARACDRPAPRCSSCRALRPRRVARLAHGQRRGPAARRRRTVFRAPLSGQSGRLARLDPHEPGLALRFELYCRGIELANGFEELCDEPQQRARFELDRQQRIRAGLSAPAVDEALLSALSAGLPAVAGVALGFDRLLMLRLGARASSRFCPLRSSGPEPHAGAAVALLLGAGNIARGAGIDLDALAFVDEQRHPHDRTGLEFGALLAAGGGIAPQARIRSRRP